MKSIILIPTYNERENIGKILFDIHRYEPDLKAIVIDDNSPDGTAHVVREIMKSNKDISLMERRNKEGLGKAYTEALNIVMNMPDIDNIVTMDGDGSHDPIYLRSLINAVADYDLVIGSRYVKGGKVENWGWHRRILSYVGNLYSRMILGIPVQDLTAGFMCFKRGILKNIDFSKFHSSGYAYLIEFKYHLIRNRVSYTEIPIIFRERKEGSSKITPAIVVGGLLIPLCLKVADLKIMRRLLDFLNI